MNIDFISLSLSLVLSYQLSFLLLDQRGDGVHATANAIRPFGRLIRFAGLRLGFRALFQTEFLLCSTLRTILLEQFEQLRRRLFVQCLSELIDRRWHFQTLQENTALTLDTDVLRPFDETGQITLVLNV